MNNVTGKEVKMTVEGGYIPVVSFLWKSKKPHLMFIVQFCSCSKGFNRAVPNQTGVTTKTELTALWFI